MGDPPLNGGRDKIMRDRGLGCPFARGVSSNNKWRGSKKGPNSKKGIELLKGKGGGLSVHSGFRAQGGKSAWEEEVSLRTGRT